LLNRNHFNTITELVNKVLKGANYTDQDIDEVFLIGGSTHIPMIRSILGEILDPAKVHTPLNPDEAVAIGAAILAAELTD
jgi:L1 cell adhesion molecule like protein